MDYMEILGEFQTSVRRALEEIDENYMSYRGVVLCGTHSPNFYEVPGLLKVIENCRTQGVPFLGICYGHQLAAIEYARNVLGIKDATSEELEYEGTFVVRKRPELKVGEFEGESYWNNYEVYLPGWEKPAHFFTTQSHPEYHSSLGSPHPLLVDFLDLCKSA